jgi:hypothetical protein
MLTFDASSGIRGRKLSLVSRSDVAPLYDPLGESELIWLRGAVSSGFLIDILPSSAAWTAELSGAGRFLASPRLDGANTQSEPSSMHR